MLRRLGIFDCQKSWITIAKRLITTLLVVGLTLSVMSCGRQGAPTIPGVTKPPSRLSEVAPPPAILELRKVLETRQPQVTILSPRSDEVLQDTSVSVRLRVNDLPLFQNEELGLGPHLHFILDNQPYEAIYDTSEPILLQDLTPGTHTIRVFASRPWHESFKNEGAYAQTTFHVFTKTPENNPGSAQPLLTYSRPKGSYGAEPVMLDFYLTNAPLHMVAKESAEDDIVDWQIRCTINGESFTFDRWEPIYLKGLRSGRNWVQLELLDEQGNPYPNAFNNTVRLINYEPDGTDALSRLVRGELSAIDAMQIVDPDYVPPAPEPEPEPELEPEITPTPTVEEPALEQPTLEPGDIPEVVPDESIAPSIVEPNELETPAPKEEPVTKTPSVPPVLTTPTAIEPPQETKMKEQLTEEVEEQLEELEATPLGGTALQESLLQESLETPIAPSDPLSSPIPVPKPDEKEKLLDRAKHFLNQVVPRPTEPSEPPSAAPVPPTTDPPVVTSPEDAVEIEETLPSL